MCVINSPCSSTTELFIQVTALHYHRYVLKTYNTGDHKFFPFYCLECDVLTFLNFRTYVIDVCRRFLHGESTRLTPCVLLRPRARVFLFQFCWRYTTIKSRFFRVIFSRDILRLLIPYSIDPSESTFSFRVKVMFLTSSEFNCISLCRHTHKPP